MVTNAPDPDSLQVTKVVIIKTQISQPSQILKMPKISVKATANIFAHRFKKTLQRLLWQIFLPEMQTVILHLSLHLNIKFWG